MKGLIQVYTGDGKGKTTASVGATVRAAGNGLKVLFVQFIKEAKSGELEILKKFPDLIKIIICTTGFIYDKPKKAQIQAVKECLESVKELIRSSRFDIVVLDEFTLAVKLGLISKKEAEQILQLKPEHTELIITGRDAPEWLIDKADLVTEMKKIKHYFDRGVNARRGIEY